MEEGKARLFKYLFDVSFFRELRKREEEARARNKDRKNSKALNTATPPGSARDGRNFVALSSKFKKGDEVDDEKKPKKPAVIDAKEVQKIKDKKKKELEEVYIIIFFLFFKTRNILCRL